MNHLKMHFLLSQIDMLQEKLTILWLGYLYLYIFTPSRNKVKILLGSQKSRLDKNLHKVIMKRSELKNKAYRKKRPKDISDYKKQLNLVLKLNKKKKIECFKNLETSKKSHPF